MLDAPFPYIGVLQKEPSSFRIYGNPFIILMLQAEGCFRLKDVSGIFQLCFIPFGAERKIVRLRLKNHLAESFLSLSAMNGN